MEIENKKTVVLPLSQCQFRDPITDEIWEYGVGDICLEGPWCVTKKDSKEVTIEYLPKDN